MTNNRKSSTFVSDVLTLMSGTTLAQVIILFTAPILTRLYGPEDFGIWAIYTSITNVIGTVVCMRYELSVMLPEHDEDAINLLALSLLIAIILSSSIIPIFWFFKQPLLSVLNSPLVENYLYLVPPFVFINGVYLSLNYWNSRTKCYKRLSTSRVSNTISTATTQIGAGLVGYSTAGGLITGSITGISVATFMIGKQIWTAEQNLIKRSISWKKIIEGAKRYRKFPLVDSWAALMNSVSWQLPSFLLSAFFSSGVVGFYAMGFRLLQLPLSFVGSSISQVFFQKANEAKSDGSLDVLVENIFRLLVIIGMFPTLILSIIGSDVFTVIFGSGWTEAGVYTQILSIWAFFWFISSPLSTLYLVLEKQQVGFKFSLFNLATRFFALLIGGLLGSARIALILFSISGILIYGYLCLKVMFYSGVKTKKALIIIYSNFQLFIPAGII